MAIDSIPLLIYRKWHRPWPRASRSTLSSVATSSAALSSVWARTTWTRVGTDWSIHDGPDARHRYSPELYDRIEARIYAAEDECDAACTECGSDGASIRPQSRLYNLCDSCKSKQSENSDKSNQS